MERLRVQFSRIPESVDPGPDLEAELTKRKLTELRKALVTSEESKIGILSSNDDMKVEI